MTKGENYNRPKSGQCITSEPIRDCKDIAAIRKLLANQPRNLCLFEMGIHTNLRIGDLLALTVGQVANLRVGDVLPVRQQKRGKYGLRTINKRVYRFIWGWFPHHPRRNLPVAHKHYGTAPTAALFPGRDGYTPLTREYTSRMIKSWCRAVGLTGNYSAHSLRKTFGYHAINTFKAPVHVVSAAFGHKDIATTLLYLGIQEADVRSLFMNEL